MEGEGGAMKDGEEGGAVNHEQVVGAWSAIAESQESSNDFCSVDVARFVAISIGKAPNCR